uniref:Putative tigger transposable element-derived n=1 Tax=Ixodes ricinus TaxID=34613 RepID=A0A147BNC8_IXORI
MAPTKRKAISFEVKKQILRDWRQGFKVGSLVRKYELSQSTISTILKSGDVVMKKAGTSGFDDKRKRLREALYEDVEEALYQWFLTIRNENMPISGPILAAKAKKFAFLLGRGDFQPGGGWIQRFKERHGIVYRNVVGEAASLDGPAKEKWLATKLPDILDRYSEKDIYNGDETALFFQMVPSKTHALKGDPCVGGKHCRLRVTVFLCANMDGSDRCKPFVIGKSKNPTCFKSQYIPVRYRHNKKAWMTRIIFEEWLIEFNNAIESQNRKVILLLDNCSAHNVSPKLTSVELMFLPPNTTAGLQPMDAGVIANFKMLYRRRMMEWLIMKIDSAVAGPSGGLASGSPDLKITLLKAVRFVYGAWYEVKETTIKNCFRKAGFVRVDDVNSENESDVLVEEMEPSDVTALWEHIAASEENTGGAMLSEYLNADSDAASCEETSEEAIVEELLSRRGAGLSNGGDDDDDSDNDGNNDSGLPPMSTQGALLSIQSLIDFVNSKGLPSAYAQQLDAMHTAIVKLQLPHKQAEILDFFERV